MTFQDKVDILYNQITIDRPEYTESELDLIFDFALGVYGNNDDTLDHISYWFLGSDFNSEA